MKLHAIFQNGTRVKDFVDMYFLLEHHLLNTYLRNYENKYSRNVLLAGHSLTFFGNIKKEFGVSMISGKEKKIENMASAFIRRYRIQKWNLENRIFLITKVEDFDAESLLVPSKMIKLKLRIKPKIIHLFRINNLNFFGIQT